MGILLNEATGERVVLHALHVFGRNNPRSDTYLSDPWVSLMHATARWYESQWLMTDHSRNGTFLNGRLLPKDELTPLMISQKFQFGSNLAPTWRVVDISAPNTSLIPVDAEHELIVLTANNLLPNSETPEISIFQASASIWMLESLTEMRELMDGDMISFSDRKYRILITSKLEETQIRGHRLSPELPHFKFNLSLDEEHTQARISLDKEWFDLGEREHHYCLVTLARKRMADSQAGVDPAAQGWLECTTLARMLGMEIQHVNILIFRARNQLMKLMPDQTQLAHIVERRRGGIRFGSFAFDIVRGSQTECEYMPDRALKT